MIKRITLAVTGSISAYKAAELTSQLTKIGYDVHIIMTQAATEFITPLTLQVLSKNPIHLDVMDEHNPKIINHIELAKRTDLFIVAPASANTIAHLAYGFADNIVTSVALAMPDETPKLIAPAMNTKMYHNTITQRNIDILKKIGYQEIEPRISLLACGDTGQGALADISTILKCIQEVAN